MKMTAEQSRAVRFWMLRNARPLDMARFRFHFERGSRNDVLDALAAYQNPDGGFGHALEADCWNPHSAPIQTWCATEILREIGFDDSRHPIVQGILRYLDSGADFRDGIWLNTTPSNDDYPHASWWAYEWNPIGENSRYNPTASLAGFVLRFADPASTLAQKARQIAGEAVASFSRRERYDDMHEAACFQQLLEGCDASGHTGAVDLPMLRGLLARVIAQTITQDKAAWRTSYVCKPSQYITDRNSIFYPVIAGDAEYEANYILETLGEDGAWPIMWSWPGYPTAWAVSQNWWRGHLIIQNMRYLKGFGAI